MMCLLFEFLLGTGKDFVDRSKTTDAYEQSCTLSFFEEDGKDFVDRSKTTDSSEQSYTLSFFEEAVQLSIRS